ncbi:MAG: sulfur carrier protein ThiS [Verrucomicrobia bacterium]|nr:sulfur carrier protein ThiS [Verrucomicrobiota bacterium]
MTAVINGNPHTLKDGSTVADLLQQFSLPAKNVVVERNGEPVNRDAFGAVRLESDDQIEIIKMVAGG